MQNNADELWDAGDMGCGELLMGLFIRMRRIQDGTLHLIANDPGAVEDIPAWCRITGHTLVHAEHPAYFLRGRKRA